MVWIKLKTSFIFIVLLIVSSVTLLAQNHRADSLQLELRKHVVNDPEKVDLLTEIAYEIALIDAKKARIYGNKALEIANKINYPKGKANSLWATGITYASTNYKTANEHFLKGLGIAQKIDDEKCVCNCYIAIGNTEREFGNLKKSLEAYNNAIRIATKLNDNNLISKIYFNISRTEARLGNYEEAINKLKEVIKLSLEISDKKMLSSGYNNLAEFYFRQGNYIGAQEYHLLSLKIKEDLKDSSAIYRTLINISKIQSEQKDYKSALINIKKAYQLSLKMEDSTRTATCLFSMGSIFMETKKPNALAHFQQALRMVEEKDYALKIEILYNIGELYTYKGDHDNAQKFLDEAMALATSAQLKYARGETGMRIGALFFARKQYSKTIIYAQEALILAKEMGYVKLIMNCYKLLSDAYAANADYNSAYRSNLNYQSVRDSLFNKENVRKIANMESSYAYEKERRQHEMEKESQSLKIRNQNQVLFFLAIVTILIVLLAFAFYWTNKLKKKVLELQIEQINDELETNQKAVTTATLKLAQNSEHDAMNVKKLENIKKNITGEGQKDVHSLITEYKIKSSNSNWEEFEVAFQKVNTSFYKNLNQYCPSLTPNERKLCAFLKLNMNNKQISQITFQSDEAIKKARMRLRKKLNLEKGVNLVTFIQSL